MSIPRLVVVLLLVLLIVAGPAIERLIDRWWSTADDEYPVRPDDTRAGTQGR
jgi:hypothetical protein